MTPIAYITVAPGLAASILHPGLENPDAAMPTLMVSLLPVGVLGLVLAGLLVSQMSTISANLNACATLFTNDMALVFAGLFVLPLYRRLRINSIPEFLEARYHKGFRGLIGFLWVFRLAAWMGVLLYLAGVVMREVTGLRLLTPTKLHTNCLIEKTFVKS